MASGLVQNHTIIGAICQKSGFSFFYKTHSTNEETFSEFLKHLRAGLLVKGKCVLVLDNHRAHKTN